jgi:DNA-binding transcriptional regulator YdaS (Cro superfamily)
MDKNIILYLRFICAAIALFLIGGIIFAVSILHKIERMTVVSENVNQKVNDIAAATAPLGHAAIAKSVKVVENIDPEYLAKSASNGLKDVGKAATDKAKAWLGTTRPTK